MRHEPIVAERVVVGRHEDAQHGESGRHVERKEAGQPGDKEWTRLHRGSLPTHPVPGGCTACHRLILRMSQSVKKERKKELEIFPSGGIIVEIFPSGGIIVEIFTSGAIIVEIFPSGGIIVEIFPSGAIIVEIFTSGGITVEIFNSGVIILEIFT